MIRKVTTAEMDQWQRNVQGEQTSREPVLMNVEAATTAHDSGYIELALKYRTRRFRVPPVPYRDGIRLLALDRHVARLQAKLNADEKNEINDDTTLRALAELAETLTELVTLFRALVRPVTLWDRLTWRVQRNPFIDAEASEIGELRRFFSAARTRCRVRWTASIRAPRYLRSTWPMNSRHLSLGSAGGWLRASHAAGPTTVSGSAR